MLPDFDSGESTLYSLDLAIGQTYAVIPHKCGVAGRADHPTSESNGKAFRPGLIPRIDEHGDIHAVKFVGMHRLGPTIRDGMDRFKQSFLVGFEDCPAPRLMLFPFAVGEYAHEFPLSLDVSCFEYMRNEAMRHHPVCNS